MVGKSGAIRGSKEISQDELKHGITGDSHLGKTRVIRGNKEMPQDELKHGITTGSHLGKSRAIRGNKMLSHELLVRIEEKRIRWLRKEFEIISL